MCVTFQHEFVVLE